MTTIKNISVLNFKSRVAV